MKTRRESRLIEGGADDDVLLGSRRNDTISGHEGDDIITGRRGRDVMHGGEGADTFAFDDLDTGDASWGRADAIGDFGREDFIDIRGAEVFQFAGFDNPNPSRGSYSIWRGGDNVYVTWNTYGTLQDVELTGFVGDHYSLNNQILWYEDDYAGTVATDGVLMPGEAVQGRIEVPGDEDWLQIEIEAGQLYVFDLKGAVDGGGTLVDPYLVLRGIDGNSVAESYEQLFYVADAAGTFFISAQSFGSTGTYTLEVTAEPYADDFGDNVDTSGQVSSGESVTGRVGTPSDQDWFEIGLQQGQLYTFTLRGAPEGGGTLPDPALDLYNVSGSWLVASGGELLYYADADATHFIAARSFGGVGTYTLEVASEAYVDDFGGDIASAGAIAPGETLTGIVGVPNDEDWFEIELEQGETYTIDMRSWLSGVGSLNNPFLQLLDADGEEIVANDDFNWPEARIVYTAQAGGTYFIAAQATEAWDTGDYQVSVSSPAAIAGAAEDLLLAA